MFALLARKNCQPCRIIRAFVTAVLLVGLCLALGYCAIVVVEHGEAPPPGCDGSLGVGGYIGVLPDFSC